MQKFVNVILSPCQLTAQLTSRLDYHLMDIAELIRQQREDRTNYLEELEEQ